VFCLVLGPLDARIGDVALALGGPAPRRLLAALLMAEGKPVGDDELIDLVWGADGPANQPAALRVVVSRLRGAMGADEGRLLERTVAGYRFRLDVAQTDAGRFTELVAAGGRLLGDGQHDRSVAAYSEALRLWRGEPWAELAESPAVTAARARLHELHAVAVEELQAARLAAGNTAEAVASLTGAVTEAPYRERRWELLVLGLYRSGRQGQALAELRRIRTLLADDLGVDPGPGLRELERQLLDHDQALLPVAATRSVPLSSTAVPVLQRRPSRPLSLCIGRESELALLSSLLEQRRLVTLVGPGGVGKTRLAVEHRAALPAASANPITPPPLLPNTSARPPARLSMSTRVSAACSSTDIVAAPPLLREFPRRS